MERTRAVFKVISFSMKPLSGKNFLDFRYLFAVRCYSDESKPVKKEKTDYRLKLREILSFPPGIQIWNESGAVKRNKRKHSVFKVTDDTVDFINNLQHLKSLPVSLTEIIYFIKKIAVRKQLLEQAYLPERRAVLRADLAAAHFLLRRGGAVKFVGKENWVGGKEKNSNIPFTYVPGFLIEAINAEGTNLYYEGLSNLSSLHFLKWLSLKGLEEMNDWCLDWISKEYCTTLEYLDISGCKGVTFRGLSCFYRFERLKTLEVKGVSESPDFKLACLMLQDVLPELEIKGIDLSVPKKIDPVNVEELKNIPKE